MKKSNAQNKNKIIRCLAGIGVLLLLTGCEKEEDRTLDETCPIPGYEGSMEMSEYTCRQLGLKLQIPKDMTVTRKTDEIVVSDREVNLSFLLTESVELETLTADVKARQGLKLYKDVDVKRTKLLGHEATAMIYNLKKESEVDRPCFYVAVDYENKENIEYDGLVIRAEESNGQDAYDLLNNPKVLAIINQAQIVGRGELDKEAPLPEADGSTEIEYFYSLEDALKIKVPEGYSVTREEEGIYLGKENTENPGDLAGYLVTILPADQEKIEEERTLLNERCQDETYYHTDYAMALWQGYPADAYIYTSGFDAAENNAAEKEAVFELVVDYQGEKHNEKDGLILRASANDDSYAYDMLEDQNILTILNQIEFLKEDGLDKEIPIPESDHLLQTTEYSADEKNLKLQIPEEMTVTEDEKSVFITGEDQLKVSFTPVLSTRELQKQSDYFHKKLEEENLLREDIAETSLFGFDAQIQIFHQGTADQGHIQILVDYGEAIVGPYTGLIIQVDKEVPSYVYEWLQDQRLLTLLENVSILKGDPQVVYNCNGITAEFPKRYQVRETEDQRGIFASYQRGEAPELQIQMTPCSKELENITFSRFYQAFDDLKTITYGEQECLWRLDEEGILHVYCPYGRFQTMDISLRLDAEADEKTLSDMLTEVLGQTDFQNTMKSLYAIPEAEAAHVDSEWDLQATDPTLFLCKDGVITDYFGSMEQKKDRDIMIPEFINGCYVTELGSGLFAETQLSSVKIPNTVTKIGDRCFYHCEDLRFQIPENVTWIGREALSRVGANLPRQEQIMMIPKGIHLEEGAFDLEYIYLKGIHGIEELPENFATCHVDSQIYLCADSAYDEMKMLDDYLAEIDGANDNTYFNFEPGSFPVMTTRDLLVDDRTILGLKSSETAICIGEYLKREDKSDYAARIVGENAFAGSEITALWIGPYIEKIKKNAFKDCEALEEIWTVGTITQVMMEEGAFEGIPANAVIHVPGRFSKQEQKAIKESFLNAGVPKTVRFDFFILKQEQ